MRCPAALLICLLVPACAGDRTARPDGGAAAAADFRLIEDLRIDGHREDLVPIGRLEVAANGTIAILQTQDQKVRFFDSAGSPAGELGGRGEGPGEFAFMNGMGWLADTLWIYDQGQRRFTLISPTLQFVRNVIAPTQARPAAADAGRLPEFRMAVPQHLYGDSTVFAAVLSPVTAGAWSADQATYARLSLDGILTSIVLEYPRGDPGVSITSGTGTAAAAMPFPIRPMNDISPDGSRIVVVSAVVEGPDAETFSVTVITALGDTTFSRVYPFDGVPIPQSVADSVIEARARSLAQRVPELAEAYRKEARVPPFFPPVEGVLLGRDGTIWIRMRDTPEGRPYLVLSPDGDPSGTLMLPPTSTIGAADLTTIWALESDENDVESVVRYRIGRD